jgi:hypothetical protein
MARVGEIQDMGSNWDSDSNLVINFIDVFMKFGRFEISKGFSDGTFQVAGDLQGLFKALLKSGINCSLWLIIMKMHLCTDVVNAMEFAEQSGMGALNTVCFPVSVREQIEAVCLSMNNATQTQQFLMNP